MTVKPFSRARILSQRARSALAAFAVAAACPLATSPASAETKRFALAVFHFNVQYVAGGLIGGPGTSPANDVSEREIEDRIITETFEPVLDLFLAHPTWGQDIELQGYMLEIMAARHPAVLEKLRMLAERKQIDVVSFHYSDQLYIAYPNVDMERSLAMNKAVFAGAAIPLSSSVFCQEGQLGLGIAAALPQNGFRTLIWSKNNFTFQHPGKQPAALYRVGDARIVVTENASTVVGADTVDATWTFVDDGELLATGGLNPYFPMKKQAAAVAEYEQKLANLVAQGFVVAPVSRYVEALEKITPGEEPPPLLDGTWQPASTGSTGRWMGGRGLFGSDERDDDVRTLGAIAHREIVVAEAAARAANLDASVDLETAWRLLALGQVSDSTGVNPIRGEVEYGLAHLSEVIRIARDVIQRAKAAVGEKRVVIDSATGTMTRADATTPPEPALTENGPVPLQIDAPSRAAQLRWQQLAPNHWVAVLATPAGDDTRIAVTVPGAMGDIVYTPSLASTPAHLPRSAFGFDTLHLPLHDGLIGLGNGRWAIKDMATIHVSATVRPTTGDVVFSDDTVSPADAVTWKIHVFEGDERAAHALASSLNVTPKVIR